MKVVLPALILASLLSAGCSDKPLDTLAGCYATGPQQEVSLKVTHDDEAFGVSLRSDNGWSDPQPMTVIDRTELDKLIASGDATPDEPAVLAGLKSADQTLALYRLSEDAKINGKAPDSQYFGSFYFGTGTVYRKECP